ncbi:MAG: hypothetical protein CYPHOPRED_005823 [Cyphobasidiales sp. Tagirdzhanova-0007]|nr:MAG: hypothetical protein CYPHOPRED_005823 [Cyphobasidiales sp. Tagirdzhanova-0007]
MINWTTRTSLHCVRSVSPTSSATLRTLFTCAHRPGSRHRPPNRALQQSVRWSSWWSWSSTATTAKPFSGSGAGQAAWESIDFLPQISPELLPLFLALLLAARDDDGSYPSASPSNPTSAQPSILVQAIPDKGLGAIATRPISRGEIIIAERPLVVWPARLDAARAQELLDQLTPSARKAYLSLANAADPSSTLDPILGIRATNGFNVELPPISPQLIPAGLLTERDKPPTASLVFPKIARINHCCAPNADHSIDWSNLRMTVYATTPIDQNDEISIEYTPSLVQKTREERRRVLKRDFGFLCRCRICGLEGEELSASDERRSEINAIVEALGTGEMKRPEMWTALERMQHLLDKEGYKAMPEFDNPRISDAYVAFVEIRLRKDREINA